MNRGDFGMRKISRVDAFLQASEAIEKNDIVKANQILRIINKSIESDKKKRTYSEEIILTREEKKYFHFDD